MTRIVRQGREYLVDRNGTLRKEALPAFRAGGRASGSCANPRDVWGRWASRVDVAISKSPDVETAGASKSCTLRRYGEFGLSCAESVQRHLRRQVPKSRGSTRRPGMGPALLSLSVAMMMVCSGCGGCRTVERGSSTRLSGTVMMMRYLRMVNACGSPEARA